MHIRKKQTFMDRAQDYVESVIPQIEAAIESAVEKAAPAVQDARSKAAPILAEGKALAADKAATGAALASTGAALAAEKAASGREVAAAKVAELRGQEPETSGGKLKKLLFLGGLLAVGGVVFKMFRKAETTPWQSSYSPPPAPSSGTSSGTASSSVSTAPGAAAGAGVGAGGSDALSDPLTDPLPPTGYEGASDETVSDDVGGAEPGEALSDAAESPHAATTPDNPAEVTDVTDPEAPRP